MDMSRDCSYVLLTLGPPSLSGDSAPFPRRARALICCEEGVRGAVDGAHDKTPDLSFVTGIAQTAHADAQPLHDVIRDAVDQ